MRLSPFLILIPFLTFGQVDALKYTDQDLFKVKPVILGQQAEESSSVENEFNVFEKGFDHWSRSEFDEAIAFFESLSRQYPELPQTHFFIGAIQYEQKQFADAASSLSTALEVDAQFFDAKYMLALVYVEQRKFKEAEVELKELMVFPDYVAKAYYGRGLLRKAKYYRSGEIAKMFKKAIEADSSFLDAYLPLASIYYYQNKKEKCLDLLNVAVSIAPDWEEGIISRALVSAEVLQTNDQFEEDLELLIRLDPTNYHYLSIRGYLKIELGRYEEAVLDIRRALNMSDTVAGNQFRFSSVLSKDDEVTSTLNYYHENIADLGLAARDHCNRGICEMFKEEFETSRIYFDSALLHTDNPVVHYLNATSYRVSGMNREALDSYTQVLEQDSSNLLTFLFRAELYEHTQALDSAVLDYTEYIRRTKREAYGYVLRGLLYYKNQLYLKAYYDFSKVISINQNNLQAFHYRAQCSYFLKQYKSSLYDLDVTINGDLYNFKSQGSYYFMHLNYLNLGDTTMALQTLDSASKYDKYNEGVHLKLIDLGTKMQVEQSVRNGYDRLVTYIRGNSTRYLARGMWLYEKGDYHDARFDLQKFIKRYPQHPAGCHFLGKTLIALGNIEEGERWLKKSKKLGYTDG